MYISEGKIRALRVDICCCCSDSSLPDSASCSELPSGNITKVLSFPSQSELYLMQPKGVNPMVAFRMVKENQSR